MTFEEWWEQNWLTITCLKPVGPGNAKETARAIWQPATAAAMERCAGICVDRASKHRDDAMNKNAGGWIRNRLADCRQEALACAQAIKEASND